MKRSFTKRLVASVVRTCGAISLIALGYAGGKAAINWPSWVPNNDAGVVFVLAFYCCVFGVIGYGVYCLSPIYIGMFIDKMFALIINATDISYYSEEDDDDESEEDIMIMPQRKICQYKKKYLW